MPRLFRFFGNAASNSAGFAIGAAVHPTLSPITQELANETWERYPNVPLDPLVLADGVATGEIPYAWAEAEARRTGTNKDRFARLVEVADQGPGVASAFELWRRGIIAEAGFRRALKRGGLEDEWIDDLVKIKQRLLSPEILANARQQGFVDEPRQKQESALQGTPDDAAEILFQLSGNPPGPETLQRAVNRGLMDQDGFDQGIREGRTKTKYTELLWLMRKPVLSAVEYAGLWLRGWITEAEAKQGGALTGYDEAQMDLIYLNRGRPATSRQVHIGYQRGGRLEGESLDERETFRRAVRQSNVRTEYEPLLWAQRYTYPSAFALRGLVQGGYVSADEADEILRFQGWEPTLARKVADAWDASRGSAQKEATATDELTLYDGLQIDRATVLNRLQSLGYDQADANRKADVLDARRVISARTTAIGEARKSFLKHEIAEPEARAALTRIGVADWAQAEMLEMWDAARDVARAGLSRAEVVRAYRRALLTLVDAIAALVAQGFSDDEARILLGLSVPTLTVKQIQDAYEGQLRTREEAGALLAALGYTVQDAQLLLGEALPGGLVDTIRNDLATGAISQAEAVARLVGLGYSEAAATAFLASA